jgi:hypothetical protein
MNKPYCVTFSGVPGSSKSIVAHYLSERFGLPIFSTDNLRFEVREDLLAKDIHAPGVLDEFNRRLGERRNWLFEHRVSYIMDGSIDRTWAEFKQRLESAGYRWHVIDMELSPAFIESLYLNTDRHWALEELSTYLGQHETFLAEFSEDIGTCITDKTFSNRTITAEAGLRALVLGDKIGTLR